MERALNFLSEKSFIPNKLAIRQFDIILVY